MLLLKSSRISTFITACIILGPSILINAAGTLINFCDTLPDSPLYSTAIETQLRDKLDKFEDRNNYVFYEMNQKAYLGFCKVFLKEPQRPRQILTAFWLKFNGYKAKIKQIHDECVEDNKKSLASTRELCKLAVNKMKATSKQHTRDIRYLMDNVRQLSIFYRSKSPLFYFIADGRQ